MLKQKVRVQVLSLEKFCHLSVTLICESNLVLLHTNIRYINATNKIAFKDARAKVKVTKIFVIALMPSFMDQF